MADGSILRARFANRVGRLMAKAGLKTSDLVALTTLPAAQIERILAGTDLLMTINDMETIAIVLGVSLYSLLAPMDR